MRYLRSIAFTHIACNEAWLAAGAATDSYDCIQVYQSCTAAEEGAGSTTSVNDATESSSPSTSQAVQCQQDFAGKSGHPSNKSGLCLKVKER